MTITISDKIFRKLKETEECQGLSEVEAEDYFQELIQDLIEDFLSEKRSGKQDLYERDQSGEEDE
jgi:predicted CopG family antitoxin